AGARGGRQGGDDRRRQGQGAVRGGPVPGPRQGRGRRRRGSGRGGVASTGSVSGPSRERWALSRRGGSGPERRTPSASPPRGYPAGWSPGGPLGSAGSEHGPQARPIATARG